MSAYSDWKCGALSDDEYSDHCAWEDRMDKAAMDKMFNDVDYPCKDCEHCKDGECEYCECVYDLPE